MSPREIRVYQGIVSARTLSAGIGLPEGGCELTLTCGHLAHVPPPFTVHFVKPEATWACAVCARLAGQVLDLHHHSLARLLELAENGGAL